MSAPGYHRRGQMRKMRDLTGLRKGAYSTMKPEVAPAPHGPTAKIAWAIRVVRMWKDAVKNGTPVKNVHYPAPPEKRLKMGRAL